MTSFITVAKCNRKFASLLRGDSQSLRVSKCHKFKVRIRKMLWVHFCHYYNKSRCPVVGCSYRLGGSHRKGNDQRGILCRSAVEKRRERREKTGRGGKSQRVTVVNVLQLVSNKLSNLRSWSIISRVTRLLEIFCEHLPIASGSFSCLGQRDPYDNVFKRLHLWKILYIRYSQCFSYFTLKGCVYFSHFSSTWRMTSWTWSGDI